MFNNNYTASVIVPVYNCSNTISRCIESILSQTVELGEIEIILVNDGSTDSSQKICEEYSSLFDFIKLIDQKNKGVSVARNVGLKAANAKYIFFLDGDDILLPETIENVVGFFKKNDDITDIVTYPLYYVRNERPSKDHFRYQFLDESGVYSLDEYPFLCQTTMNVSIKKNNDNQIFFDESLDVQEDQDFIYRYMRIKNNIGFVKEAGYYYYIHNDSASRTKNSPLFSFEDTISYYERNFSDNETDINLQSLYLYNINWRLKSDQLFPYYLEDEAYQQAFKRILNILNKIDISTIMKHPGLDLYHKFYLLKLKKCPVTVIPQDEGIYAYSGKKFLYKSDHIEIIINKISVIDNNLKIIAYIKSPIFDYTETPNLFAVINDNEVKKLDVFESVACRYKTKVKTNLFYGFYFEECIENISKLEFKLFLCNKKIPITYYFMPTTPIVRQLKRNNFFCDRYNVIFSNNNSFTIAKISSPEQAFPSRIQLGQTYPKEYQLLRSAACVPHGRIWLYYDCKGISQDNGIIQFMFDSRHTKDGIERFFVWNNPLSDLPDCIPKKLHTRIIEFGGLKHKILLLQAEKIITSFVEHNNIYPFSSDEFKYISDMVVQDITYLQHGILHAHVPWKYTPEVTHYDKIVISSFFEEENLQKEYNVRPSDMIRSGMPRFDLLDIKKRPLNKILFAPTWRSYLIDPQKDGVWGLQNERFISSTYYKKINEFLTSTKLHSLLEKNDLILEFKIHPIFEGYSDLFSYQNERIQKADSQIEEEDYCLFITDYSSFLFDFAYLKRPILYFITDIDQFKAGLASYRKLDLPLESGFGHVTNTVKDLIKEISALIDKKFIPERKYKDRMAEFFLDDENRRSSIYNALYHK